MPCKNELERESRIILQTMIKQKYFVKNLPMNEVALYKNNAEQKAFVKKVPKEIVEFMHSNGWLKHSDDHYYYTIKGKEWVSKFIYFLDLKHEEQEKSMPYSLEKTIEQRADKAFVEKDCNLAPILKLYNRQKNISQKYLTQSHVDAGLRLFKQFINANLQPNVTMNWDKLKSVPQSHYMGDKATSLPERTYVARKQIYESLAHVGEEYAAILVEVCLFGNGLEATEKTMNWPARSGKLLLTMGLDKLAQHYGIQTNKTDNKYLMWAKPPHVGCG